MSNETKVLPHFHNQVLMTPFQFHELGKHFEETGQTVFDVVSNMTANLLLSNILVPMQPSTNYKNEYYKH